jgi:peptide/nickel transport system substrate-binding protein
VKTLQGDSKFGVQKVVTYGYLMLQLNVANEGGIGTPPGKPNSPFTNPLIREAFELSLDRDQLNTVVFNGLNVPGCTPLPPHSPFAPTVTCSKRDVAKAKDLIRQAGVPTPVKVDLLVLNTTEQQRLGEVVQAQAKDAGFDVTVKPTEATVAQEAGRKGQFQASFGAWSGRVDPDGNIWQFQHTKGADNQSNVSDPAIDSLLDKGRTEVNIDARKKLYADAVNAILARKNTLYLGYQVVYAAYPATVQGFEMYADGMPRLKNAGFAAK